MRLPQTEELSDNGWNPAPVGGFLCRPIAGQPALLARATSGGAFIRGLPLSREEQLTSSSQYQSTHSVIMDDFRRLTIQPMLKATLSTRLTIEQSLETITSTRAALVTVDALARTIDDALMYWRQCSR